MNKILNAWKDIAAIENTFEATLSPTIELLATTDNGEFYESSCFILFLDAGKLYTVEGAHCSWYGYEGQWAPDETDVKTLKFRCERGALLEEFPGDEQKFIELLNELEAQGY